MFSATKLQIATYLLGVCPFSIAFLVFLNSSVSFVVTDLIGQRHSVGDAVGSLGFADELLALVACPLWGLLSDRIGVRWVCVLGYTIIALALLLFVQAKNVYPQLLLGRLFFSLGGAAASTMVTAVLPAVSSQEKRELDCYPSANERSHTASPSITSDLTITPARYRHHAPPKLTTSTQTRSSYKSTSRVAGFVGMFTGAGALIALLIFLPLPARFQHSGLSPARALQHSFYIVAAIALILAIWCFIGLRHLASEKPTTTSNGKAYEPTRSTITQHLRHLLTNLKVAFKASRHPTITLGYLGGFVARASSVGISLFIPLLVNALFLDSDLCRPDTSNPSALSSSSSSSSSSPDHDTPPPGLPDLKHSCPRAYLLAAALTGVAETVALIAAPLFGYLSARCSSRRGVPMMIAAAMGVVGYPLFVAMFDPDDTRRGKRLGAFAAVMLVGGSQIGAIVGSLGCLGAGVLEAGSGRDGEGVGGEDGVAVNGMNGTNGTTAIETNAQDVEATTDGAHGERDALLGTVAKDQDSAQNPPLSELKGAIAGIYSFYGGLAILLLTKLGGSLFDSVSRGAPFYIMAVFNAVLFVVCGILGLRKEDDGEASHSGGEGEGGGLRSQQRQHEDHTR